MADNPELTVELRPVGGEPFLVLTADFADVQAVLAAVSRAMKDDGVLILRHTVQDTAEAEHRVTFANLTNIVSVRVTHQGVRGETGQYL
jgi:hypothetical protein